MLKVSELYIYPVKSLGGIALNKANVTDRGFEYDRRWMLVNENNVFISQREVPQMALMKLQLTNGGVSVHHQVKNSSYTIPFEPLTDEFAEVIIWDDTCKGLYVSAEADNWFSEMLQIECRLVFMPDKTRRSTDQKYAPGNYITSFADAYPFLMIGQASLDDLNSRLDEPLPMDRFRPNIVFTGGSPFEEDMMHTFIIGDITLHGIKLCARCPIPTIDQATAIKGKEPLKTLAQYRFKNNQVWFGQNLIHEGTGEIVLGSEINILKRNDDNRFRMDNA